jgi:hypothetical protein
MREIVSPLSGFPSPFGQRREAAEQWNGTDVLLLETAPDKLLLEGGTDAIILEGTK